MELKSNGEGKEPLAAAKATTASPISVVDRGKGDAAQGTMPSAGHNAGTLTTGANARGPGGEVDVPRKRRAALKTAWQQN